MYRLVLLIYIALFTMISNKAFAKTDTKIDRIEPMHWYVGMKDPTVQLMVYGNNIGETDVTCNSKEIKIDSVVRLDSPNYLLVYLNIKDAKASDIQLTFTNNSNKSIKIKYLLRERAMRGEEHKGFSSEDVLYMLMPDRFSDGGRDVSKIKGLNTYKIDRTKPSLRHGGTLEGIRQHLDYFTDLGVTALWFTPVLENNSPDQDEQSTYHGYATTNYYRVDPRFGSNEDYCRLIKEAHDKGLKVVMDMIFNHSGFEHPWVKDMPTKDWLNTPDWLEESKGRSKVNAQYLQTSYKLTPVLDPYASKIDLSETVDGWFVPTMPDLNQKNPHLMRYLIQNSIWWIEYAGIDGIRMDTYPYADRKAMAHWMKVLDEEYPNFNTVGETWVSEPAYTAAWQKDSKLSDINSHLKTVMDFSFFDKINQAKNEETDAWWNGFNRVYNSLVYDYLYPNPSSVMAFIENHDTDRFLAKGKDTLALKQALALLLTVNRIPQLYYGTEVLMNGTKEVTDGYVREDFPGGFVGDKRSAFTKEGRTKEENAMYQWLKTLLHWRKGNEVISRGSQTQFIPYKGVYVIAREYKGQTVLTIINGTSKNADFFVERYKEVLKGRIKAREVLSGQKIDISKNIILSPRQVLVLEY